MNVIVGDDELTFKKYIGGGGFGMVFQVTYLSNTYAAKVIIKGDYLGEFDISSRLRDISYTMSPASDHIIRSEKIICCRYPMLTQVMIKECPPTVNPIEKVISLSPENAPIILFPLAKCSLDRLNISDLTLNDRIDLAYQIISGVEFLHGCGIFHLDIKLQNILLFDEKSGDSGDCEIIVKYKTSRDKYKLATKPRVFDTLDLTPVKTVSRKHVTKSEFKRGIHARISDFGISLYADRCMKRKHKNIFMTGCFRPPELLIRNNIYSGSNDVWTLGIILLYIFSEYLFELRMTNPSEQLRCISEAFSSASNRYKFIRGKISRLIKCLGSKRGNDHDLVCLRKIIFVESITKLLCSVLNPSAGLRISAKQILRDSVFSDLCQFGDSSSPMTHVESDFVINFRQSSNIVETEQGYYIFLASIDEKTSKIMGDLYVFMEGIDSSPELMMMSLFLFVRIISMSQRGVDFRPTNSIMHSFIESLIEERSSYIPMCVTSKKIDIKIDEELAYISAYICSKILKNEFMSKAAAAKIGKPMLEIHTCVMDVCRALDYNILPFSPYTLSNDTKYENEILSSLMDGYLCVPKGVEEKCGFDVVDVEMCHPEKMTCTTWVFYCPLIWNSTT